MYSTECAWEVSTTNRYTITTYEAAVTARRRIKQGETIKYLIGTLVPLTLEESAELDLTNRNFSIVTSSRKKNSSIFLGPARFANHDCDANGRLVIKSNESMEVIAMKNIEVGDEITVSYGDDYFGPDNVDCLCYTCETLERNGWTSKALSQGFDSSASTPAPVLELGAFEPGKKRKCDSAFPPQPATPRPTKKRGIQPSPSKLQQSWTPPSTSASVVEDEVNLASFQTEPLQLPSDEQALSPPRSPTRLGRRESESQLRENAGNVDVELDVLHEARPMMSRRKSSSSLRSKKTPRVDKMTARLLGNLPDRKTALPSPSSSSSSGQDIDVCDNSTDLPSKEPMSVTIKIESKETTKVETDPIGLANPSIAGQGIEHIMRSDQCGGNPEPGVLSTVATIEVTKTVSRNASQPSILPSVEQSTTTTASITVRNMSDTVRVPGDYVLTRKLLAQPHDRWVQCHNQRCLGCFIQPNGYQTRRECPRCERHSMLYGFAWPKTDPDQRKLLERKKEHHPGRGRRNDAPQASAYKRSGRSGKGTWVEGGGDDEERVMDHRTVHRFVLPDEEKEITRRGLLLQAEQARARGKDGAVLERGNSARGTGTESIMREMSEGYGSASGTPDDGRRRSNRIVKERVYADV